MVLLFDIDGTLLAGHGVGRRAIEAVLDAHDTPFDTSEVPFGGKTDPQIFGELLGAMADAGLDPGLTAEAFAAAYADEMLRTLPEARVEALPGAVDLVHRLRADGVPLGLLTGNLEPLGYGKIARIGLGHAELPFGAFGSDHADRNALPSIAAQRASATLGREVNGPDLVIIGDTPRDIECARAVGATVVAVATGHYAADALADADLVLDSLDAFSLDALS